MKKFIISLLILLMIAVPVTANDFTLVSVTYPVLVDGQQLPSDKPVLNLDGTTYVPLKSVLDLMGAQTEWKDGKVDIGTNKMDAASLENLLDSQYSVINIRAKKTGSTLSQGTGFAVLDGSYIVTNSHVVGDNKTAQGKNELDSKFYDLDVIINEPQKDIAILKLKDRDTNYMPLVLGDSDTVKMQDSSITFGFPFNSETSMIDYGYIAQYIDFEGIRCFWSNAYVNHGSSGGPLVNIKGEVIGVTTGGDGDGDSYSIPINIVKDILKTIK